MDSARDAYDRAYAQAHDAFTTLSPGAQICVGISGAAVGLCLVGSRFSRGDKAYHRKPSSFELGGGSIAAKDVDKEFKDYAKSYGKVAGAGISDRSRTVELVDVFYSLVTDLYEWGWGQSFHFSPRLPGKDWKASEAAHEARIAALLNLVPGQRALDCGCGVGGPMRTIAAVSGAHVTGITINEYQVKRAQYHNESQGLIQLTDVVRGDFTAMPFTDCSYDGAYAIEATCHAPKLEQVFGEVYRVLKPGSYFISYEWVSTKHYNGANKDHVRIIDEINFGNGLPEMRTYIEAENAGKNVGFELITSLDLAEASIVASPWYNRLKMGRYQHHINQAIVDTLHYLGLAPKGLKDVHHMLVSVAASLVEGGETKIFSPMHMLLFRKPLATPAPSAAAVAAKTTPTKKH